MNPGTADTDLVTCDAFRRRLAALCLGRGGRAFPRGERDRHILYRSAAEGFQPRATYSESEVNGVLSAWLSTVGSAIAVDHVTLRRHMVDAGYLMRDPRGTAYAVRLEGDSTVVFAPDIQGIDSAGVIAEARQAAADRGRDWASRGATPEG